MAPFFRNPELDFNLNFWIEPWSDNKSFFKKNNQVICKSNINNIIETWMSISERSPEMGIIINSIPKARRRKEAKFSKT